MHIVGGRHLIGALGYVSLGRTEKICNSPTEGAGWSEGRSPFPLPFTALMENFPTYQACEQKFTKPANFIHRGP